MNRKTTQYIKNRMLHVISRETGHQISRLVMRLLKKLTAGKKEEMR